MNTYKATLLATLLILTACTNDNSPTQADLQALSARIQSLEAESQIRHKLQTYMAVLTAADWDNYVNYFTRDGKIIMTEGTRQGRDDIKERMSTASARLTSAASNQPPRKRRDVLTNIEIQVTSATTANAQSRFIFLAENGQGGFEVTGSGLYIDEWALEEGEWRIAARTVDYDLLRAAAPQTPPPAPAAQSQ